MNTFLRDQIMRIMQGHRGRVNAMLRRDLLAHLQLFRPTLSDREMREKIESLPGPGEGEEMKKTIKAWGLFVKDKIKNVYEDEGEARFALDLEKYMSIERKSKKALAAHIKSVELRRITIIVED